MIRSELQTLGAQLAETKPTILIFWDEECEACVEEMPKHVLLHKQWAERVNFNGVCLNQKGINWDLLTKHNITWTQIALSWTHPLIEKLQIDSIPKCVIIDENERLAVFDTGTQIRAVLNGIHATRSLDETPHRPVATIIPPRKIIIKDAGEKGAGVFAVEAIPEGDVIETCHVVDIPNGSLRDYGFLWREEWGVKSVLPLGNGCIYNHSSKPNATWRQHSTTKSMEFIAIRDIAPGDEICTFYGPDAYWQDKSLTPIQ